jgi:outer membrane protein assembly factor BamD (BamD/ComL family)
MSEEITLIDGIRVALAAGETLSARSLLGNYRSRFPKGRLEQEAAVLEVELEAKSGDRARAESLARAFVEKHPNSPLAARALGVAISQRNP